MKQFLIHLQCQMLYSHKVNIFEGNLPKSTIKIRIPQQNHWLEWNEQQTQIELHPPGNSHRPKLMIELIIAHNDKLFTMCDSSNWTYLFKITFIRWIWEKIVTRELNESNLNTIIAENCMKIAFPHQYLNSIQ